MFFDFRSEARCNVTSQELPSLLIKERDMKRKLLALAAAIEDEIIAVNDAINSSSVACKIEKHTDVQYLYYKYEEGLGSALHELNKVIIAITTHGFTKQNWEGCGEQGVAHDD